MFATVLVAACTYAWLVKPVYRAQVVMVPAENQDASGLGSLIGQFGGLAALAGVNIGKSGSILDEAIAVLGSRAFIERFIRARDLLPILFARKWDESTRRWDVRDPDDVPTLFDGTEKFDRDVYRVAHDEGSNIVTLTVDWHDRQLAVRWANELVAALNDEMRQRAKNEATRSLNYLSETAKRTSEVAIREAVYKLVENQIKIIMLADVRREYAFRVVGPPILPDADRYVWPKRPLIIAAAVVIGGVLALLYALLVDAVRRLRESMAA